MNESAHISEQCEQPAPQEFPAPIGKLLGLRLMRNGPRRAMVEFDADERYANPMGTMHGGVLCDIADSAMGAAYLSCLVEGETFTTIELKINFLRPVRTGKLRAEARTVRSGHTIDPVECDIFDQQQHLVARASSTCMTLRGILAEGRELHA